eukprot:6500934-Prymnesium_polylepis.1
MGRVWHGRACAEGGYEVWWGVWHGRACAEGGSDRPRRDDGRSEGGDDDREGLPHIRGTRGAK